VLSFREFNEDLTYEDWELALSYVESDYLNEGLLDNFKIPAKIAKLFNTIKKEIGIIIDKFKLNIKDAVNAFKERHVFGILKGVGFSFKSLYRLYLDAYNLIVKGLFKTFEDIHKTKIFQKIQKGTIKIDEVLAKYPILKKLTGPIVAGLLLYIWLNMSFIGDLEYDMNIVNMFSALQGNFSVEDLFGSKDGLLLITLFGSGITLGLSAPWLGKTVLNMVLALVYTGLKYSKSDNKLINRLHSYINN